MAIEQLPARLPRELPAPRAVAAPIDLVLAPEKSRRRAIAEPSSQTWPRPVMRVLEMVPGAVALFLISTLVWGWVWFPTEIAVGMLCFDCYWLWKSWTIAFHVVKGVRSMRAFEDRDWRAEYSAAVAAGADVLPWDGIKHVVIIPNYKETIDKLRETLDATARTTSAATTVIPVLAMEEAEAGAREKAEILYAEFAGRFFDLLVTFHPAGLPGEVRGKSSNQHWAARCAVEDLVGRRGLNLDLLTVTSCDADTIFPSEYFDCLRFMFATDPMRYRRFWQAPIFFYNNIWRVPPALRIPNALSGLVHLSRLSRSRKRRVLFSQSTYSLSMRMAHDVGYWDTDVIPEDWHMFLKCFYNLRGTVDVEPIYLPIGNDGALSHGVRETFVNQYLQVRRWAWGATDIPLFLREAFRRTEIPLLRRFMRFWYLFENHMMWSTQWFFITLGGLIPWAVDRVTGVVLVPRWFYLDVFVQETFLHRWITQTYLPGFVTLPTIILTPCLLFYLVLITIDLRLRPPSPHPLSFAHRLFHLAHWLAISPITFFFSALPALDSQVRLLLGRRMEYRVTEKI